MIKAHGLQASLLYKLIVCLAMAEAIICFLQYVEVIKSMDHNFKVTGTWQNPNVTAMFLALCVPCVFTLIDCDRGFLKKSVKWILLILFLALLSLQCRTAIVGALVTIVVVINYKYQILRKAIVKSNRALVIFVSGVFMMVALCLFNYAYHAKKESADGRKLIWKISGQMFLDKPLTGFGYGSFERNYNLYQSRFFQGNEASDNEKRNAAFVRMGYNEFIQNAVEGGFPGVILMTGFFLSLLLIPVHHNFKENGDENVSANDRSFSNSLIVPYAGVAAFVVMSLVNFSLQAIPVFCLFIVYAAILAAYTRPMLIIKRSLYFTAKITRLLTVVACCFGCYALYTGILMIRDNLRNKQALILANQANYKQAEAILSPLSPDHLDAYESYWTNYANILFRKGDYLGAITKFEKAKSLTSDPSVYVKCAICYSQTGDLPHTLQDLTIAENIEPNRLLPRFYLMNLYFKLKDTSNTIREANTIIRISPKKKSKESQSFKYKALAILAQLDPKRSLARQAVYAPTIKFLSNEHK